MKQHRLSKGLIIGLIAGVNAISLVIFQAYMVFQTQNSIDNGKIPGTIGLREYFDSGDGSSTDPYVITRPRHFYNLSRLQALGAFNSQKYFQLGKTAAIDGTNHFYADDINDTSSAYLDLTDYSQTIVSIGSSSTPFFGVFDGQGFTIKGLSVTSDPEDIGVFGYIAPNGKVKNVNFSNLTVNDNGYGDFQREFYEKSIEKNDDLHLLSYTAGGTSLAFSSTAVSTTDLSGTFNLDATGMSSIISYANISYAIRSTNPTILVLSDDKQSISIDTAGLIGTEGARTAFYNTSGSQVSTRIYATATMIKNNIQYAKIIGTWTVTFDNVISGTTHTITMNVTRDRDASGSTYEHNTNIGFICGHCDGSMTDDYVYCGSLNLNKTTSVGGVTYVNQAAETEMGLIGEIGINIDNNISPKINYDDAGDTGIINFTNIYKDIINLDDTEWDSSQISTGSNTYTVFVIKYRKATNHYDSFLRKRVASTADQTINGQDDTTVAAQTQTGTIAPVTDTTIADVAVTNAKNSIDFQGQKIIKEDADYSRGLGIFKLNTSATAYSESDYASGMGDFTIKYDANNVYSNVYYSTAEFNATLNSSLTPQQYYNSLGGDVTSWKPDTLDKDFRINQGTFLPTSSFSSIFLSNGDSLTHASSGLLSSSKFEKNFNYLLKLNLEDLSSANSGSSDNYFYNTANGFLRDYFTYKLRDKNGETIDKSSSDFGLMIKEKNGSSFLNTTSFSSYLGLSQQQGGVINAMTVSDTDSEGNTQTVTVPTKTIEFSVKNEFGANITLIASSDSAEESHVCIYDKAITTFTDSGTGPKNSTGLYPSYAMYIPANTTDDSSQAKMPYYFTYDNSSHNVTSALASKLTNHSSENRLYAHTFFLPQGNYYIGSPDGNEKIYYMAVQGQNGLGNLGGKKQIFSDNDVISNVDFLLDDPVTSALNRAYVDFQASFDALPNTLTASINAQTLSLSFTTSSTAYSYLVYNYSKDIKTNDNVYVNGTSYNKTYIKSANWVG
ncbi:MAG: hypothetical protein LKJ88_07965 [Bacilli bacterium]|jgi:hypothetical protein|nr:hypothetical protein [Bacilli bacterium]